MNEHTYNSDDCTCGKDHDALGHITVNALQWFEDRAAQTEEMYSPAEVGVYVQGAAEHVGWYRDVDKATASYNNVECVCGRDHDNLDHIVTAAIGIALSRPVTVQGLAEMIDSAAERVGWVKA